MCDFEKIIKAKFESGRLAMAFVFVHSPSSPGLALTSAYPHRLSPYDIVPVEPLSEGAAAEVPDFMDMA